MISIRSSDQFTNAEIKSWLVIWELTSLCCCNQCTISNSQRFGGEVRCIRSDISYAEPLRLLGLMFALKMLRMRTVCLWVILGGHKLGLKSRLVARGKAAARASKCLMTRPGEREVTALESEEGHSDVCITAATSVREKPIIKITQAYKLHVIDTSVDYPKENWLQRSAGYSFTHS